MDKDSMRRFKNLINEPDLNDRMDDIYNNLDRAERMKDQRKTAKEPSVRAKDIRSSLDFVMKQNVDSSSDKIGLILTGGGGKGSYQAGALKALDRNTIGGVAGTSAGALNAAAFSSGNVYEAERLWSNLDEEKMLGSEGFFSPSDENDRYLKKLIKDSGVLPKINPDSMPTVVTAFDYNRAYPKDFLLNNLDDEEKLKCLLASAAVPIALKEQTIRGVNYIDGGIPVFGSNMPVAPLYHLGFRKFIVIHCSSIWEALEFTLLNKLNLKLNHEMYFNGASFVHLFPSRHMGGLLEGVTNFSHEFIMKNIKLGYSDMEKARKYLKVFSEDVGEYDEIHIVNGKRYRSFQDVLDHI